MEILFFLPTLSISILLLLFPYYFVNATLESILDPVEGFITLPLNHSNLVVQRPYELSISQRYCYVNGVHKLWVFSTDIHSPTCKSKPRTEIKIQGYDYSSGVWQFEAYGYVSSGTSGVCIMQVFGADPPHGTTLMLRVYNGSLSYYRNPIGGVPNIYDRWFRLNVIHNVDADIVKVFIDGILKFKGLGRGGTSHYFKFGVYAQSDESNFMESRWKDIKILKIFEARDNVTDQLWSST